MKFFEKHVGPTADNIFPVYTHLNYLTDLIQFKIGILLLLVLPSLFLTFSLPNSVGLFFIHLKLELLTQFPTPNDKT